MNKVESYRCEKCGRLFHSPESCAKHEREAVRKVSIWWRPDNCLYTFSDIEEDIPCNRGLVVRSDKDLCQFFIQYCSSWQSDDIKAIRFYMDVEGHMVAAAARYLKEWVTNTMKRSSNNATMFTEDER